MIKNSPANINGIQNNGSL